MIISTCPHLPPKTKYHPQSNCRANEVCAKTHFIGSFFMSKSNSIPINPRNIQKFRKRLDKHMFCKYNINYSLRRATTEYTMFF